MNACGSLPHDCWNRTGVNRPLQSMRLTKDDDNNDDGIVGFDVCDEG